MSEAALNSTASSGGQKDIPPLMPRRDKSGLWRWIGVATAALFVITGALLFWFNPADHSFYPFCVFHRMTGLECPGCGGLRAAHQLLHGHFATAFRYNPLIVTAAPIVLVVLTLRALRKPKRPVSHRAMAIWAWIAFVVLVSFWILRNLPIEFFKLPAQ